MRDSIYGAFLCFTGIAAMAAFSVGCAPGNSSPSAMSKQKSAFTPMNDAILNAVAGKRIFFGHQSVGYNIVEGIGDLAREHRAAKLTLAEASEPSAFERAGIVHTTVGRNGDPESKLADFARYVHGGMGGRADVALFKFCYIDIEHDTDVQQLFTKYKQTLTGLEKQYPTTRFVHVTTPIRVTAAGWKAHLRTLLKRPQVETDRNRQRDRFNDLMRREYAGRAPLFDLAALEATTADGSQLSVERSGTRVPYLDPEYAADAGHLNAKGRKYIAGHLLSLLAQL